MDGVDVGLSVVGTSAAAAAACYWGIGLSQTKPGRAMLRRAVLSHVKTTRQVVALTFDDGPDPFYTPRFLEALGEARATFFVLGAGVRRWPGIAGETVAAGHELACHGEDHRSLATMGPIATRDALMRARDSVAEVGGRAPRFYRPAYGVFNLPGWVLSPRLGMRRTLWSAWARDWEARATPESIARRLLRDARPGAILLLHDSDGSTGAPARTLEALPTILSGLGERGLESLPLSELVAGTEAIAR